MTKYHVTPSDGLTVKSPDHDGQSLPASGAPVEWSVYWERRLKAGEITRTEITDTPSQAPLKTTKREA